MIAYDLDADRELAARALAEDCASVAATAPAGDMLADLCATTYRAALVSGDAATWRDLWHLIAALVRTTQNRADGAYARLAAFVAENTDLAFTHG